MCMGCIPFGLLQGRGRKTEMSGRKRNGELSIERSTEIKQGKKNDVETAARLRYIATT